MLALIIKDYHDLSRLAGHPSIRLFHNMIKITGVVFFRLEWMTRMNYVLGIDVGTSGVKIVAVDRQGQIAARGSEPLPPPLIEGKHREQAAELWWIATEQALIKTLVALNECHGNTRNIDAIAIDGTSGTIVPIDSNLNALSPGFMYNDGRAVDEADELNEAGAGVLARLGYRFNASFSLAKIRWWQKHDPALYEKTYCFLHQADTITARLTGGACFSDESNTLKSGYDILEGQWPDYLETLCLDRSKLPTVASIGAPIATVSSVVAERYGLSPTCLVVGGMSDGTAACVASGAREIGDLNTTLGSTIVWKIVSSRLICDPEGRLYCHRHPGGGFLPGGAGNAGGEGLQRFFAGGVETAVQSLDELAGCIVPGIPTGSFTYPLPCPGERYPFVDSHFQPFTTANTQDALHLYRSCLEGIAYIERWGYDVAAELGAETLGSVWTTGKGAELNAWMQIRADVLQRPVCRVASPDSAYGSALVAAMRVWFDGGWSDTAAQLIHEAYRCEPNPELLSMYDETYMQFRRLCESRRKR